MSEYKVLNPEGSSETRQAGWEIGFGLQRADGLEPSQYAYDVAKRHIAGQITYDDAARELKEYHHNNPNEQAHEEADIVSQRISEILQAPVFAFSPDILKLIHTRLFKDVFPANWVGKFRTENISKSEDVLNGEYVMYSDFSWIEPTLDYDFSQEKEKRTTTYTKLTRQQIADSVFDFFVRHLANSPVSRG
jgi:fido (protein-threonine AMPylation protein)